MLLATLIVAAGVATGLALRGGRPAPAPVPDVDMAVALGDAPPGSLPAGPPPGPPPATARASAGVPIVPAAPGDAGADVPPHPHPLTPGHDRIFRENALIGAMNGALDVKDGLGLRA